jgi:hypothetical protein
MWLNPMVRVLCHGDMRPRSKDMGPQLRDMITWFRDMRSCMCAVHSWASMRSAAPGLVQRTMWPLTVGQNRLCESKNTKACQAKMDEKCAPSSHTPSLLLLQLLQCALFCFVKLYLLVDITSRRLFLFWDLGFRTWTDKQTDIVALIYKITYQPTYLSKSQHTYLPTYLPIYLS